MSIGYFALRLNLESSANQAELIQTLKNDGAEVIQTSGGLCIKTLKSESELQTLLAEKKMASGVTLKPLNPESLEPSEATPDVRSFLGL